MIRHPRQPDTLGVYYEHPAWFEPMFAEFDRRGVRYERLLAHEHHFDPSEERPRFALLLNRMSPSAGSRGHGHAIPYTLDYLAHLDAIGANVLNGLAPYRYEFSKARQLGLLARLGLRHPRSRVINHPQQAPVAAEALRYPIVVKPNIGGSGAGIRRFERREELLAAVDEGLELGLDGIGLVQEYLRPRSGSVVRVEFLAGRPLYAIRLRLETPDSFNLCPADYCRLPDGGGRSLTGGTAPIEGIEPPAEAVAAVERITRAAGIEVGGVEYLIDDDSGELVYYDINALSNFVADAPRIIGFDPFPKLVDFVLERAGLVAQAAD